MPQQEHTLRVNDMDLFYRIHGDGLPLLLLHGYLGSSAMWDPYLDELAQHFRLIIPDLRGHGRSTNPASEFTHRQAALDIYALLDSLGIECTRAVGASTGGMTLLHMATQQPQRIEAMVLFGTTTYYPAQARALIRAIDHAERAGQAHGGDATPPPGGRGADREAVLALLPVRATVTTI